MNREILFRGKRKDNGNWIEGYFVLLAINEGLKHAIYTGTDEGRFILFEVIPDTVGQFTGLCDKNGNKIFEGDILTLEDTYNGDVQFSCGVFGIEWSAMKRHKNLRGFGARHNLLTFEDGVNEDLEIIGNIFDNPELLEEKL